MISNVMRKLVIINEIMILIILTHGTCYSQSSSDINQLQNLYKDIEHLDSIQNKQLAVIFHNDPKAAFKSCFEILNSDQDTVKSLHLGRRLAKDSIYTDYTTICSNLNEYNNTSCVWFSNILILNNLMREYKTRKKDTISIAELNMLYEVLPHLFKGLLSDYDVTTIIGIHDKARMTDITYMVLMGMVCQFGFESYGYFSKTEEEPTLIEKYNEWNRWYVGAKELVVFRTTLPYFCTDQINTILDTIK